MPQTALLTVHGMGETPRDYAVEIIRRLGERLADVAERIDFRSIYYQDILKPNQETVWARIDGATKVHYDDLRRFLLFGFGDAAGLENRKEDDGSVYELAQDAIARQLLGVYRNAPDASIVFLAHSLGCQVLSSYLYDAQKALAGGVVAAGVWKDIGAWSRRALGHVLTDQERRFVAGGSCAALVTTGCNIPIFVAAHKQMDIKPIARPTPRFTWTNIYDPDDALGWPLQPLSPGYAALVQDRVINAGQGMVNWIVKSWNPWSHTVYWSDGQVLEAIAAILRREAG
ncbi:hypothetical protein QPK32_08415 [Massilia sp. YIM B02763]|uniref:hypothetical protein n=1 Tax=Massilia sp. YIM B02763 TaxID=3050130 RepID=UPI0025B6F208|nr:hypothetical protein [Massilia sp. YIM B02763]MDN4053099.1 hypothetical protein [Massilia sp. YIM B02763]